MNYIPRMIAHRGASEAAPENTLPAFERAWRDGADGVELDVRMTADSQIVCIHDEDTQRVAGNSLVVASQSYAALQELDVGAWKGAEFKGTRIPLLRDLLSRAPGGKQIFIELKPGVEAVPALLEAIEASTVEVRQVSVLTFDLAVAKKVKQLRPEMRVQWLLEAKSNWLGRSNLKVEDVLETLIGTNIDSIGVQNHSGINRMMVKSILGASVRLNIWTVDDPAEARRYASFGVSSITTNRPKAILDALR